MREAVVEKKLRLAGEEEAAEEEAANKEREAPRLAVRASGIARCRQRSDWAAVRRLRFTADMVKTGRPIDRELRAADKDAERRQAD